MDEKTPHESSWAPLLWAMKLLTRAKDEGKIKIADPVFANLQSSFTEIEDCNRKLLSYGWVNFPLAYTQVTLMKLVENRSFTRIFFEKFNVKMYLLNFWL